MFVSDSGRCLKGALGPGGQTDGPGALEVPVEGWMEVRKGTCTALQCGLYPTKQG